MNDAEWRDGGRVMDDYRDELFKERAEWADLESDIAQARKYSVVGGWLWWFCDLFDRIASKGRADVQADIDDLKRRIEETEGRGE